MKISKYKIPFQSALFRRNMIIVSTSAESALASAKCLEPYAPDHCFGTPEEIEIIHESKEEKKP